MKRLLAHYGSRTLLLISITCVGGFSQTNIVKQNVAYTCRTQPIGVFRQVTSASLELSDEFINYSALEPNKESDTRERRWTLSPLDEVDPAYQFNVFKSETESKNSKCVDEADVSGMLISPTGKLFDFSRASYDFVSRKLKFTTIERDGIKYEVEAQFYAESIFVKGMFQQGTVKLKCSGKSV